VATGVTAMSKSVLGHFGQPGQVVKDARATGVHNVDTQSGSVPTAASLAISSWAVSARDGGAAAIALAQRCHCFPCPETRVASFGTA